MTVMTGTRPAVVPSGKSVQSSQSLDVTSSPARPHIIPRAPPSSCLLVWCGPGDGALPADAPEPAPQLARAPLTMDPAVNLHLRGTSTRLSALRAKQ